MVRSVVGIHPCTARGHAIGTFLLARFATATGSNRPFRASGFHCGVAPWRIGRSKRRPPFSFPSISPHGHANRSWHGARAASNAHRRRLVSFRPVSLVPPWTVGPFGLPSVLATWSRTCGPQGFQGVRRGVFEDPPTPTGRLRNQDPYPDRTPFPEEDQRTALHSSPAHGVPGRSWPLPSPAEDLPSPQHLCLCV